MMELLTLSQTRSCAKKLTIVVYGSKYWKEIITSTAGAPRHDLARRLAAIPLCGRPATPSRLLKPG